MNKKALAAANKAFSKRKPGHSIVYVIKSVEIIQAFLKKGK